MSQAVGADGLSSERPYRPSEQLGLFAAADGSSTGRVRCLPSGCLLALRESLLPKTAGFSVLLTLDPVFDGLVVASRVSFCG